MAALLKCKISSGQNAVDIIKAVDIREGKMSYLSVLSNELASLQESVNHTLSELVDKEKAVGVAQRRGLISDSDDDNGMYD